MGVYGVYAMKTNKQIIEALRDNADLAWAAYGFFDMGEYDNGELGYRYENATEQNEDKMPLVVTSARKHNKERDCKQSLT